MTAAFPEVTILYQQGACLAVFKPAGVATQAPPGIDSLELRLKHQLAQQADRDRPVYLGVPHRLDRPVSGAMLFATSRNMARRLSRQFEHREVRKTYWAVVSGTVEPSVGTWQDFIRKVPGEARAETVPADHPDAQLAVLHYRVRGQLAEGTWLEITLETGRTHQIRVQAAARGLPILGDVQYGSTAAFGPATEDPRQRVIALHGRELRFRDPTTQQSVTVTAQLPAPWLELSPHMKDLFA